MPLINGIKMACEPCIHGHRSTKCTHANERLMVPVKKPGRPLSTCPHLPDKLCGCSSVLAAIPRKHKCPCGTKVSAGPPPAVQPPLATSAIPDIPSPTTAIFRVQRSPLSSTPGSGKQLYGPSNLEQMDRSNVYINLYQNPVSGTSLGPAVCNGQLAPRMYVQYANNLQDLQPNAEIRDLLYQRHYADFRGQPHYINKAYTVSGGANAIANDSYVQQEIVGATPVAGLAPLGGLSGCGTEICNRHAPYEAQVHDGKESRSGTFSTDVPALSGISSISSGCIPETPKSNEHSEKDQHLFPIEHSISQDAYEAYISQATTYAYPASYASYQHPLQPWEWHSMSNVHARPIPHPQMSGVLTSDTLRIPETLHICDCGDSCQCIRCAAHPYNAATQNYIRSAHMAREPSASPTTEYVNDHNSTRFTLSMDTLEEDINRNVSSYGNSDGQSSHIAEAASDSSTAEEQTLPTSDYFFVSYPFSSESCGIDTTNCPCGDDCECVGCVIRRFELPENCHQQ